MYCQLLYILIFSRLVPLLVFHYESLDHEYHKWQSGSNLNLLLVPSQQMSTDIFVPLIRYTFCSIEQLQIWKPWFLFSDFLFTCLVSFFFFWFSWISIVTQLYASCNTCANLSSKSKQPFCQGTNTSFAYFFFYCSSHSLFPWFWFSHIFPVCLSDVMWYVLSCTESHARVATVVSCKSDITSLSSVL